MTTNVLWAGTTGGKKVVSIFNNPTGQQGSNLPLTNPTTYLNRIYFDTRFDYLNIIQKTDFVQNYSLVTADPDPTVTTKNTNEYTIAIHNFGYVPAAILIDYDTREIIAGHTYVQIVNNNSFRIVSLAMDSTKFYIKERNIVNTDSLTTLTRRYTLLAFENTASVPSF
jgi:hypothetical protein